MSLCLPDSTHSSYSAKLCRVGGISQKILGGKGGRQLRIQAQALVSSKLRHCTRGQPHLPGRRKVGGDPSPGVQPGPGPKGLWGEGRTVPPFRGVLYTPLGNSCSKRKTRAGRLNGFRGTFFLLSHRLVRKVGEGEEEQFPKVCDKTAQ